MIARVKHGESQANESHENGVPEQTIHGWLKDAENLHNFVVMVDSTDGMKIKKARTAKDSKLDKVDFTQFVKDSQAGTLISSLVLRIQAQKKYTADNDLDQIYNVQATALLQNATR